MPSFYVIIKIGDYMIEEYTLKKLCDKYNISADKIIRKNNNILERGQYLDIDKTLNYLIIDLHIDPGNIEKCPSVLYRNVDDVKLNYEFLLNNNVSVNDINTCLNVLSTDHFELKKTYSLILYLVHQY